MPVKLFFLIRLLTVSFYFTLTLFLSQTVLFNESASFNHSLVFAKPSVKASGSCINWNAKTINEKAKPFDAYIDQYAREYKVDKNLIKSVITAESCFQVKAESHKGAQGLMQLIPATDSFKPQQNIRGGTQYLRFLMDRFDHDVNKVIASYNAGEGTVSKYKGVPPYKETKQYLKNVLQVYHTLDPKISEHYALGFKPPAQGNKAGRQGWEYNKSIAPHLYKQ